MSDALKTKLPMWFTIAAVAAILWSLAGVASFYFDATMSDETLAKMPAAQRDLYEARPAWVFALYAVAVFGSLAGAALLFIRKRVSTPVLGVSLAAVVIQMGYVLFGMNAVATLGASAAIFPAVIVILGAAMLWLSLTAKGKGWLQ